MNLIKKIKVWLQLFPYVDSKHQCDPVAIALAYRDMQYKTKRNKLTQDATDHFDKKVIRRINKYAEKYK